DSQSSALGSAPYADPINTYVELVYQNPPVLNSVSGTFVAERCVVSVNHDVLVNIAKTAKRPMAGGSLAYARQSPEKGFDMMKCGLNCRTERVIRAEHLPPYIETDPWDIVPWAPGPVEPRQQMDDLAFAWLNYRRKDDPTKVARITDYAPHKPSYDGFTF